MKSERPRTGTGWTRHRGAVLALVLLGATACVYFNTFYNAQKYFARAEKARREDIRTASLQEAEGKVQLSPKTRQLYDKAAKKASRVLEKYPESDRIDDALFMLGKAFFWQQDYLSAERSFADLEKSFPESRYYGRSRYWRARCLEEQGKYAESRSLYQELVSGTDRVVAAEAGLRLGEMDYERKDYASAVQEFRSTLKAWPHSPAEPRLWLRLGESLMALGDSTRYAEALDAFDRILHLPASTETEYRARLNRGRVLKAQGRDREALRWYTALLRDGRFRAFEGQTRILIGRYYQERGDLEAAVAQYEQVRDDFPQTPSSAMALYQTGLLYLRGYGDEERARDYLKEVEREKGASEAAELSREMLGYLQRLSRLRVDIQRADSLASIRAAGENAPGVAGGTDSLSSSGDSVATSGIGTDAASQRSAGMTTVPEGAAPQQSARQSRGPFDPRERADVLEDLLAAAELYRDPQRIAVPDSAIHYLQEVLRRAPDCPQRPRVLYSIAWIDLELKHDETAARPLLEELIADYPRTEYANAARGKLGLPLVPTDGEAAAAAFREIEKLRLQDPKATSAYVPLLDSLSVRYPDTEAGAKAAYLAAFTMENVVGDSVEAARRYAAVAARFPHTKYGHLVAARDSVVQHGLLAKLERGIKSVGGAALPGERITVLAAQPDSMDSLAWARRYQALALRAQRRGDLPLARENFELSLQERKRQPEVHYQLGNVLLEQGYLADAVEQYQKALIQRPNMLDAQYRLFAAYREQGEADSASCYLRSIMLRDPRNPQVQLLREQYPDLTQGDPPEDLDLSVLQEIDLVPPDQDLELRPDGTLQEPPVVRRAVLPKPPPALEDTIVVILDLLVDKDGSVAEAEVFSGPDSLRVTALAAARRYTFFPALDRRGHPVAVWIELELPFLPLGDGADPASASPDDSVSVPREP